MAEYTLFTQPMSRGQIARWALHEVGADYAHHLVDLSAKPAALTINQPKNEMATEMANEMLLNKPALGNFYDLINDAKKQLIIRAVAAAKGNYTEAAKLLDVHPNHLHRLIRNLDMKGELLKFHP